MHKSASFGGSLHHFYRHKPLQITRTSTPHTSVHSCMREAKKKTNAISTRLVFFFTITLHFIIIIILQQYSEYSNYRHDVTYDSTKIDIDTSIKVGKRLYSTD